MKIILAADILTVILVPGEGNQYRSLGTAICVVVTTLGWYVPMTEDDLMKCKLRGPYLPVGDTEWVCTTHNVEAVLRDPNSPVIKREDMRCPVGEPDD